jgi:hypothetical protein
MEFVIGDEGGGTCDTSRVIIPNEAIRFLPFNPLPQSLPSLKHLSKSCFDEIYEPAEDTDLFVDTLHADQAALNSRKPVVCLEVG